VLAKIGRPPRLDHVEVSRHHHGNYRVNIWEQPEANKNIAVTSSIRIRSSYYLTVSDTGEIIDSNPPLTKLSDSA
jgi:ABC-type Zn2+ transport system substrate-binding protein/surface adhesin